MKTPKQKAAGELVKLIEKEWKPDRKEDTPPCKKADKQVFGNIAQAFPWTLEDLLK